MSNKRIEYIDAMRGFTMILVVYSHICRYCLGDETMGFNGVFFLFRLPCFFFISGWLFEQVGRVWNRGTVKRVVSRKFMVQIVPTLVFLLLLAPPPLFFSRLGALKGGYWFTFALFEFFVLYILSSVCLRSNRRHMFVFALLLSAAAYFYDAFYNTSFRDMGIVTDVLGLLGFITWRYYIFFFIGTWVKRHFPAFLHRFDASAQVVSPRIVSTLVFLGVAVLPHSESAAFEFVRFLVGGVAGVLMVFGFFQRQAHWFSSDRRLGRSLQYVGRRTLDVYLLHYFVLPRFLLTYGPQLRACANPFLELLVSLLLSLGVVVVCLTASYVIRLNHFLGQYLFGVTYDEQQKNQQKNP